MAIVVKDRVQETSTTTGTSDFTLGGAVTGFQAFSAIGNGNVTYYAAVDPMSGDWEVGIGTYSTTGPTLTRTTILSSSAAGAKISFGAGTKNVFCAYPAEKAIYEEPSGNTLIDGGPLTIVGSGVTSYTTFSAALGELYANVNSFAQFYAQNYNTGSEASGDFVVYRNDAANDTAKFVDMGINSSNYSSASYPIFSAGSAYVFNDGGEFFLGSATDDVIIFAGGVDVADEAARFDKTTKALTTVSDVNVGGNVNAQGGTFTAPVTTTSTSVTSPANNEFVTKSYVDNATSTGIHIHTPCYAETSADLSATAGYTQGGTTFNITDITGGNTVVTSTTHGLSVNDEIWLTTTAGNGLSINTAYFVYATPTTTSLQLSTSYGGTLLTGLTNASGLSYATRANSGVGAYWESTANATFTISGVTGLTVGARILVYQQLNSAYNGVYTITSLGSGSTKWKLTRATDSDKYEPQNTAGMGAGDYFFIQSNSESYVLTTPGVIIIGYTGLTYTLFSSVPVYTGGTNIDITGTTISLTGTVAATNGGTGVNTVATGDLLYGSGTNTWGKLGIGAAYKALVVNGAGTNVEWNAIALDQSGAVSGILGATNGGTGIGSYSVGEMVFANTTTSLDKVTANTTTTKKFLSQTGTGTSGQAPTWAQPAASDITGLAPSATTDTTNASNITSGTLPTGRLSGSYTGITGVGTLTAGTWNGDTVAANYGGTGFSSYTVGDILYADTTTTLARLADVDVGNALISGGVSANPSWGKIGLSTHVSGTLPIANGGTNATATPTAGAIAVGTGSAYSFTSAGTTGQVLTSAGSGTPTWTTATNANTASAIVQRDASGNFSAGTITATLSGSATQVSNAVTFNTSGGAAAGTTFNGSAARTVDYSTVGASPLAGSSSITTVGTVTTGTWNATTIAVNKGGTGATTLTANNVILGNGTSAVQFVAPGASGNVLTSDGTTWTSAPSTSLPIVATPTNVSPANGATGVSTTPTLTASTYYALYNYPQGASQWQVSTNSGFTGLVVNTGDVAAGTSYSVSSGLGLLTTYYWRCRYKDGVAGNYSSWSTGTSFTTNNIYTVAVLVVSGGGGGGQDQGGGGGGSAYSYSTSVSLTKSTVYSISVGGGGGAPGGTGGNTSAFGYTPQAGYGGASTFAGGGTSGNGYGGGGGARFVGGGGGGGNTGGGAGADPGTGGPGTVITLGATYSFGGGGGGGRYCSAGGGAGQNGGGTGGYYSAGSAGTFGGGGGGGAWCSAIYNGGSGGGGFVVVRIPTSLYSGVTTGSPTVTTDASYTYLYYAGAGSYTG